MKKTGIPLITPSEAIGLILDGIEQLEPETVPLKKSHGRILAEDIFSDTDIPHFDNSAMDGYALAASSTGGAAPGKPLSLPVIGEVKAGDDVIPAIRPGECIRIMTGAPIPAGADTIIPVENTREAENIVYIESESSPGDHIRNAGEDIAKGQQVFPRGHHIKPADTGLLASLNLTEIRVSRRPLVGIISTGNEIVDPGEPLGPGKIRNSNALTLNAEIGKYGAVPRYLGIARDSIKETRDIFSRAMECDVIITTGGVSMGKYDFVTEALRELGIEIIFENIKMKPGKPCVHGRLSGKLFFGLPGNPVSTMVSFIQFVRPALLALMGACRLEKPLVRARLAHAITKKKGRANYLRGVFSIVDGFFHVRETGPQGSGILRSMSEANCLIILPSELEKAKAGDLVDIQLIQHEEI